MIKVFLDLCTDEQVMRNFQEPFICMVISCATSFTNRQKRTEIVWMTAVKKLINQSGSLENKVKFNWHTNKSNCLRIRDACEYLLQFVI